MRPSSRTTSKCRSTPSATAWITLGRAPRYTRSASARCQPISSRCGRADQAGHHHGRAFLGIHHQGRAGGRRAVSGGHGGEAAGPNGAGIATSGGLDGGVAAASRGRRQAASLWNCRDELDPVRVRSLLPFRTRALVDRVPRQRHHARLRSSTSRSRPTSFSAPAVSWRWPSLAA